MRIEVEKLIGCNTQYIKRKNDSIKNNFWIAVLNSLIKFNEKSIVYEEKIFKTPIFYNKIGGEDIYYDKWFKKGARLINDLINDNGEFFSYEEFSEILSIQTNYLQYCGTIKAIKAYLKNNNISLTHKSQNPFIPSHISPIIKKQAGSKGYVWYFKP